MDSRLCSGAYRTCKYHSAYVKVPREEVLYLENYKGITTGILNIAVATGEVAALLVTIMWLSGVALYLDVGKK